MTISRPLRRTFAAAAAAATAFGAVAAVGLATLGPGLGTAQAICNPSCHGTWCPGQPVEYLIRDLANTWDQSVCHDWYQVVNGPEAHVVEGGLPEGTFVCQPWQFMCP